MSKTKTNNVKLELFQEQYNITELNQIYNDYKNKLEELPIDTLTVLLQYEFDVSEPLSIAVKNNNYKANDEALVYLAQNGDEEAKNKISIQYIEFVSNVVKGLIKKGIYNKGDDSEDLIQTGYVGFYDAIKDFKIEMKKPFELFTRNVVSRQIKSLIKRSHTDKLLALNTAYSFNSPINTDSDSTFEEMLRTNEYFPEEMLLNKEEFYQFWATLSKSEQRVLWYRSRDYSYKEVGGIVFKEKAPKEQAKSVDNAVQRIGKKREAFTKKIDGSLIKTQKQTL